MGELREAHPGRGSVLFDVDVVLHGRCAACAGR
jgi:hypothetical protein